MLIPPTSVEYTAVALPTRSPAVTDTRRVPLTPLTTRHRIDVSDAHSVPSHPVCPSRTPPVYALRP
eukprot:3298794-Rhodomonas_salina.1